MDWTLIIFVVVAGGGLWWAAFYATKQMRIGKNKEREEAARKALAARADAAAQAADTRGE